MQKDKAINEVVDRLCAMFGDRIRLVDYWTADLCAVGFQGAEHPSPVVYVSVFSKPPGRYFIAVEDEQAAGRTTREINDGSFDDLVSLIDSLVGPARS